MPKKINNHLASLGQKGVLHISLGVILVILLAVGYFSYKQNEVGISSLLNSLPRFFGFLPSAAGGKLVYTAGIKATGAPYLAYTEDITVASPIWTENSNGLPASVIHIDFILDPHNPNAGYIVLDRNAGSGDEVWKNSGLKSGGTWVKIFDVGIFNQYDAVKNSSLVIQYGPLATITFAGRPESPSFKGSLVISKKEPNVIGFVAHTHGRFDGDPAWIVTSEDGGASFTVVNTRDGQPASSTNPPFNGWRNVMMWWSEHNANRVFISYSGGLFGAQVIWQSDDKGKTFGDAPIYSQGNASPIQLYFQKEDNPDDSIVYGIQVVATYGIARSTNGGRTWTDYGPTFPTDKGHIFEMVGNTAIAGDLGTTAYKSTDKGSTWSSASVPVVISSLAFIKEGQYLACGSYDGTEVAISSDWVTFTKAVGDLQTKLGGPFDCHSIAVEALITDVLPVPPTTLPSPSPTPPPSGGISGCNFTRGGESLPIKSSTLANWITTVAREQGIPPAVLASVAMHESQTFIVNKGDTDPAITSNYYCEPGVTFCEWKAVRVEHYGACTSAELAKGFRTATAYGIMQFIDIYNPSENICSITDSLKLASEKLIDDGLVATPSRSQVNNSIRKYYNSCYYDYLGREYNYCEEVWQDYQNCKGV